MAEFLQYQSFASAEVAEPLLALLGQHGIPFEAEMDKPVYNTNFAFNATDARFVVRLQPGSFDTARRLEDQSNEQLAAQAASDHYLYGFSDEELFDLLVKPDEWSSYDVTLATQILRQRGRDVTPDTVRLLRQHRVAEMAKPEPSLKIWIWAGYFFAALGGFIGIFIGWHLRYHKKTLPDGSQVFAHSASDRAHGMRILVVGFLGALLALVLRLELLW